MKNKKPFNIFPSIGYRNSQYQICSDINELTINIFYNNILEKSIIAGSECPTLLNKLENSGTYIAKCEVDGVVYEQEIHVRDAYRLGSSKYKKAFLFDNSQYSFFLMKDRLLLFDENKKVLLTENQYSPTEILQIDSSNFLFITKLNGLYEKTKLGIYNTDTFSIVSELVNDYRLIQLQPELNKVWLLNQNNNTFHCFKIISRTGYFEEILKFENYKNFNWYERKLKKRIEYLDKVYFICFENDKVFEIPKAENIAIDCYGNYLEINENIVKFNNALNEISIEAQINEEIYLNTDYFFIGQNIKKSSFFKNLYVECDKMKKEIEKDLTDDLKEYVYYFEDSKIKTEMIVSHFFYQSNEGLILEKKEIERKFLGINLSKNKNLWSVKEIVSKVIFKTLYYCNKNSCLNLFETSENLEIIDSNAHCLLVKNNNGVFLLRDSEKHILNTNANFELFTINERSYLLTNHNALYSLLSIKNEIKIIFEDVKIHNVELLKVHKKIFYSVNEGELFYYDLSKGFYSPFDIKLNSSDNGMSNKYIFTENYGFSPNNILFNPKNLDIKNIYSNIIETFSRQLNKVLSIKSNNLILSVYNPFKNKYEDIEIEMEKQDFKESYLSPNGEFLVLKNESNQYLWYDIKKNEEVRLFNGTFLEFSKEGNLIMEDYIDRTRKVKIFDPITFSDITPVNYDYYKFKSHDGKLFAELDLKTKFTNSLNGIEINRDKYREFMFNLGELKIIGEKMGADEILEYKENLFLDYKSKFEELEVSDYKKITTDDFIEIEKYIEIGIVETKTKTKVFLPKDTEYYNYASFSFDNKFVGIVGKPIITSKNKSLILLCSIRFDEKNNLLKINDIMVSREPRWASWVCGFSITGYFATYDSSPTTYIININNFIVNNSKIDHKNREYDENTINFDVDNIKIWEKIITKNFLCFSPSGNFMALSEQGYDPFTLGGYGHQESKAVHIAYTDTGEIIDSFTGHGDQVGSINSKNVTFVAFSEDERRIMSRSDDGVVIIRNINLK